MKLTYLYEGKAPKKSSGDSNDKEVRGVVALAGSSDETKGQSSKGPAKHPVLGASQGPYMGPQT